MKVIFFIIVLFFTSSIYSQINEKKAIDSDLLTFQNRLKTNELNKSDWEEIWNKTISLIKSRNFERAKEYANKAKLLAKFLNDDLIIARSWHLIGKSHMSLGPFNKTAIDAFSMSLNTFAKVEKTPESRKWAGYMANDLSFLYIDPQYSKTQPDIKAAMVLLSNVYQSNLKYESVDKKELEVLTAINIGNAFYQSGHIISQLVFLEYALSIYERHSAIIDNYFYFLINFRLQKVYRRLGEYEKAFNCLKRTEKYLLENPNDYLRIDYLYDLQDAYTDINQTSQMFSTLDQGIQLAEKVQYRIEDFYSMKMKMLLANNQVQEAKALLIGLESKRFDGKLLKFENLDLAVIKAVIAGYQGNQTESNILFENAHFVLKNELESNWQPAVFLLNWEATIAIHLKDYRKAERVLDEYLTVSIQNNQKDSLPWIYLTLAKTQTGLGDNGKAKEFLNKSIDLIEEKRRIGAAQLSIGVMDVLFEAYQLKIELEEEKFDINESFQTTELLKSRWLQDKISNNRFSSRNNTDETMRQSIFSQALKFLEKPFDPEVSLQLFALESKSLFENTSSTKPNEDINLLKSLDDSSLDSETAVISYAFTSKSLIAFVYQKGEKLKSYKLNLTLAETDQLTKETHQKIKKFVFYRQNGKTLYDLLLKPLQLDNIKKLIIVPDKSLWKMPFQAFSADGKSYLIEKIRLSYAPSISILLKQISMPKAERKSFQVFSNAFYDNYLLKYADSEAINLARIYGIQPNLSATVRQFRDKSEQSDILHFSMHAEFDDEPFKSFLAFKKDASYPNGKLTVSDLLNLKLKSQSLVFLASCSTNNVFSSEGLVSLSWGMLGAGATTVISAQWEADDSSTEHFTKRFYYYYRNGNSTSESLQKTAIEMINSPHEKLNKPFYWAEFTLNGDYR